MIRVIIWESDDAPKNGRFMARLLIDGKFSPAVAHGDDREELLSRMNAFLESEKQRYSVAPVPKRKKKSTDTAPAEPEYNLDELLS